MKITIYVNEKLIKDLLVATKTIKRSAVYKNLFEAVAEFVIDKINKGEASEEVVFSIHDILRRLK